MPIANIFLSHSGVILGYNWLWLPDAVLNDFFFKNLLYQNNCKEAINIGVGQIRDTEQKIEQFTDKNVEF